MNQTVWWPVQGASMWPLFAPLEVQLAPADRIDVGDIIGFIGERPGTLVLHRVTAVHGDRIEARGDTNRRADPPVPRQAVIGKLAALRVGPVALRWPAGGVPAELLRRLGQGWSQVAPALRSGWSRLRRRGQKC
ncbi:MAG: hypothetical protein HY902_07025 [Deltaproteobacteria bacterium]|nr:hypothetical protein [Deltaproteobacteria bacterium]